MAIFIPLAEESSLIVEMGEWILREACREAASWSKPLQIAVNLSPAQFMHGDLHPARGRKQLDRRNGRMDLARGLPGGCVVVEAAADRGQPVAGAVHAWRSSSRSRKKAA